MGEAKRRGTYEQRKTLAKERDSKTQLEQKRVEAEYEASLTPEQKRSRTRRSLLMSSVLATTLLS